MTSLGNRDTAIELMRAGIYQPALSIFKNLIAEEPQDWSLFYMAGQCARFLNDIPGAVNFLARAAALNETEPQVFLALGIAQQLMGELLQSQEALRKALEIDSDMESAYNSLGITQKKAGFLDLAAHNHEEALKALSRNIAKGMRNQEQSKIFPHPEVRGTYWARCAMNAALSLSALEPDITNLAWPTGEEAIAETQSQAHRGLYWRDTTDARGAKTRLFLPNCFNTFFAILTKDRAYADMLGNLGSVFELQGRQQEADECFDEATEILRL